ncbi:MAG: TetR/AcrR family transcriptional regulator [Acidimicrobiales bacterium]|jgi:AcrR family transcriptional regulator|nr:TetR/AcrR family transcriptional regulator [Actinomycetes bacterium]MDP6106306.1 TetR/AcrR family transcriptional regulator [Acidimicrobiales bacterium]MDP6493289.1 TetR/AcrR family transcriptional regulator [Acidimicrobiales bacterium]MDP6648964.1 TetR/AcrR family transcriptional regulator [Acidimicrobiales bacterium]MDP6760836.1 TetR/AcrR family transcriptional regulator [Acidimicrobiales bacterium]|tara:strand:+ start:1032 stop:1619 length:588 start_codon:yes stop_codon:yes gene_type:complete
MSATATVRMPAARRREQLLDIALGIFARNGYHETSMNALAAEAGVTKPVLYQHFASKRELFAQLLARTGDRLHSAIAERSAGVDTPRQRVEVGFAAFFHFFDEHPDAFSVLYGSSLGSVPEFKREARRVQDTFTAILARLINGVDGDDALVMAAGINGIAEGMVRYWMHEGRRHSADEMATLTTRLAWGGLEDLS